MPKLTKREARRLWVKALRSGEYAQGKRFLRMGNKYCCLGVATDLYSKIEGYLEIATSEEGIYHYGGSSYKLGYVWLPPEVQTWLGLCHPAGTYLGGPSLAALNDAGVPFSEIADIIESEPFALFEEAPSNEGTAEEEVKSGN